MNKIFLAEVDRKTGELVNRYDWVQGCDFQPLWPNKKSAARGRVNRQTKPIKVRIVKVK